MSDDRTERDERRPPRNAEDLLNRNAERRYETPRQYERDDDKSEDPVMPADDSTLKTKI